MNLADARNTMTSQVDVRTKTPNLEVCKTNNSGCWEFFSTCEDVQIANGVELKLSGKFERSGYCGRDAGEIFKRVLSGISIGRPPAHAEKSKIR